MVKGNEFIDFLSIRYKVHSKGIKQISGHTCQPRHRSKLIIARCDYTSVGEKIDIKVNYADKKLLIDI